MAVAFDAVGPSAAGQGQTGGASPLTWSHTCSGSDRALIVGVVLASSADGAINTTATYNGVSMNSVAGEVHSNAATMGYAEMFVLANPASGTNTVSVTITGATVEGLECGSVSFTGADQANPIAHQATATGNSTSATVAVTSATDNMVVDLVACGTSIGASNQTSRWLLNRNSSTAAGNGAQATAPGAASVTMTRTIPTEFWSIIAADIAAAPTGPPPTPSAPMRLVRQFMSMGARRMATVTSVAAAFREPPEVPQTISSLVGWFDATRITGLADGAAVGQWDDLSGASRHLLQSTGANQPTYQTNELNSNPVVRFDGSNDTLATNAFTAEAQPHTIFSVVRFASIAASSYIFDGIGTADRHALFYFTGSSQMEQYAGSSITGGAPSVGTGLIFSSVFNGASSELFKNGTSVATGDCGGNLITGLTLGGRFNAIDLLNGDIGEVIVYNRALSVGERQQVEDYLTTKWGITAATSAPAATATGSATGETPQISISVNPTTATSTALANDAVTTTATVAQAETATATAVAETPTATHTSNILATAATATGDAQNTQPTIHVNPTTATATADGLDAVATSGTIALAQTASTTAVAHNLTTLLSPVAEAALVIGDASEGAQRLVSVDATTATSTSVSNDVSATIAPLAEVAPASGTAEQTKVTTSTVVESAEATATAQDPTITTTGASNAPAQTATATATAHDITTTIASGIQAATALADAQNATAAVEVRADAQTATGVGTAQDTSGTNIAVGIQAATVAADALDATAVVGTFVNPATAEAIAQANDPAPSISTPVAAQTASATADAQNASFGLGKTPNTATATADGQDTASRIAPVVDVGIGTAQAQDAQASTTGQTFANAEAAIVTGTAGQLSVGIGTTVQEATTASIANAISASVGVFGDTALGSGAAINITTHPIIIYGQTYVAVYLSYRFTPRYAQKFAAIVPASEYDVWLGAGVP